MENPSEAEPSTSPSEDEIREARVAMKVNRQAAKEWINKKTGVGLLITQDDAGEFRVFTLGDPEKMAGLEVEITDPVFKMVLALVASHLPGSSRNHQIMYQNTMQGLQAVNQNIMQLVSMLQMKFPELQVQVAGSQTKSGLIVPGK